MYFFGKTVTRLSALQKLKAILRPAEDPWHSHVASEIAAAIKPNAYREVVVYHGVTFKK